MHIASKIEPQIQDQAFSGNSIPFQLLEKPVQVSPSHGAHVDIGYLVSCLLLDNLPTARDPLFQKQPVFSSRRYGFHRDINILFQFLAFERKRHAFPEHAVEIRPYILLWFDGFSVNGDEFISNSYTLFLVIKGSVLDDPFQCDFFVREFKDSSHMSAWLFGPSLARPTHSGV